MQFLAPRWLCGTPTLDRRLAHRQTSRTYCERHTNFERFRRQKIFLRMKIFAEIAGLMAALLLSAAVKAQTAQPDSSVPLLWDLTHRVEKPDTSGLRLIRFMTEDDYPPFDFTLPDGTLTGFNVDLARAICEELQVACTVQARRWDTLIASLEENRGDAIIASMQINNETRKHVAF